MDFIRAREDNWEGRYAAWKESRKNKQEKFQLFKKNEEKLREFDEKEKEEIETIEHTDLYSIKEFVEPRRNLIILLLIILAAIIFLWVVFKYR